MRGRVPGMAEATFREQAEAAKENCPISQALSDNIVLRVEARLEG